MISFRVGSAIFCGVEIWCCGKSCQRRTAPIVDVLGLHGSMCPWADSSVRRRNMLRDGVISELTGMYVDGSTPDPRMGNGLGRQYSRCTPGLG